MAHKPFQRKDRFYKQAKKEGYPARSVYKIFEMDKRFKIFKPGNTVLDLGCAPGGWMKAGEELMKDKGQLIGIDLLPLNYNQHRNTLFLQDDFTKPESQEWLKEQMKKPADWVLSDLSPNISGVRFRDRFDSFNLCMMAMIFAVSVLKNGGGFVCKLFPGAEVEEFRKEVKKHFGKLTTVVPEATRKSSTEIYIVCQNKKTIKPE